MESSSAVTRVLLGGALMVAGLAGCATYLVAVDVFGVPAGRSHEVGLLMSYGFAAAIVGGLLSLSIRLTGRGGWKRCATWLAICNGVGAMAIVFSRCLSTWIYLR